MAETTAKIPQRIHVPRDTVDGNPDAGGGIGRNHLPHRNQQEHDGMHQRDDGAFAVGENGKSAHADHTVAKVADTRL